MNNGDDQTNDAIWVCGCAFLAGIIMFIIEKGVPLLFGGEIGGHHHSHNIQQQGLDHIIENGNKNVKISSTINVTDDLEMEGTTVTQQEIINLEPKSETQKKTFANLPPVALMVVIGDGLHNITDGLTIGAAFAMDPITGMATALAVLCHELPHELGDFALLLQTGVSLKTAFYYNVLSSVLSFIGKKKNFNFRHF